MGKLRIGYEDVAQVREGGSIMLSLVAGHLVRKYNVVPTIADAEGLVYDMPIKLRSLEIQCNEVAEDVVSTIF